jgi:ligand-binding sensor domain-containing protein
MRMGWPRIARSRLAFAVLAVLAGARPVWSLDATRRPTQYTLQKWDAGTGLPHESIQALVQTPDGYLWLGTMGGLVRFDGVRFTHYTPNNSGLPHNNVWSLAVDGSGRLWLGTDGGGAAIWNGDGTVERFGKAEGFTSDKIRPIFMARDGSVWVATHGGGVNRYHDGRWTAFTSKDGLANDFVWALAEDSSGRIWLGTNGNGIDVLEAGRVVAHYDVKDGLPQGAIAALTFTRNGDLWAGTFDGLARFREGRWRRWSRQEGLPAQVVRTIREDGDGNLWLGTAEGVARMQGDSVEALPPEEGGGAYVRAMIEDREGNLWVGLFGAGLRRLTDETFFAVGRPEGAPFLATYTVLEAQDGSMWVSTYRGAWRFKDGEFSSVTTRDGLPSDSIGVLAEDGDGGIWIGTSARGLGYWRAGKVAKFTEKEGLPNESIRALLVDSTGSVWAGTTGGLALLRDGRWQRHAGALAHEHVRVLMEARDGSLWAGGPTSLSHYKNGEWAPVPLPGLKSSSAVLALREDTEGRVWAGTAEHGLCRVAGGPPACFRVEGELFDTAIFSILEDDVGYLWVSSAKGVTRIAKKALEDAAPGARVPFESFGRDDGMRTSQVNSGAGTRARDGRLWFPTMTGLAAVDPRRIEKNTLPPVVRIEELHADGSPVALGEPVLGPGVRRLELRYTGLSLSALDKVSFRYRLDPFDTEWIEAGTRRVAYYTSLPAGRYVFRVTACNNDGACDEKGASSTFTLRPHIYQRRGFWLAVLFLLVAVGISAYRIRTAQLRAREKELQRRVDEATARIKVLDGMLPICAGCKKVRDDTGYWDQIETYISNHSRASFSHGMCPDCVRRLYPEYAAATDAGAPPRDRES